MSNLRIISDNAIDRATLSASSTAGSFNLASLQSPRKSDVWRAAAGATARLSTTWVAAEPIQAVALPFCNLSPAATMRVRVTSEQPATNLFLFSDQFENAAWAKGSTTTINTAGLTAGPDGTMNARTFWGSAAGTNTLSQAITLTQGQPYTFSTLYKIGTFTGTITFTDSTEAGTLSYSLQTSVATVSGIFTAPVVTNYGNGWYRVSCTVTPTIATAAHTFVLSSPSGTSYSYVWGMMLNTGGLSSYYPSLGVPGVRPLGYIDSWQGYAYDSGTVLACPAPAIKLRGFTAAQSASAYAFGGGAHARHWLPASVNATGLAVDISDPANLAGSIETSFLVAGPYWESTTNFDYGASAQLVDSSKNDRNDAGDLITDAGTVSQRLSIPMSKLAPSDRAALWSILRAGGTRYPVFASMFPGDADLARERDHQVLGRLVQLPAMSLPFFNIASATVEIESI